MGDADYLRNVPPITSTRTLGCQRTPELISPLDFHLVIKLHHAERAPNASQITLKPCFSFVCDPLGGSDSCAIQRYELQKSDPGVDSVCAGIDSSVT